jgi:hypothetical protein
LVAEYLKREYNLGLSFPHHCGTFLHGAIHA